MNDGRTLGAAHAFGDGLSRVAAAPAVLAGAIAAVLLYGTPADLRGGAGAILLWAFLSGGILDRYARRRATRAHGFFAACGAHCGAMLRLAAFILLAIAAFHVVAGDSFSNPYVHESGFVLALVLVLVLSFAQVRIAVEDRRSALGALRAGGRFVLRNPAAAALYAFAVVLMLSTQIAYEWIGWRVDRASPAGSMLAAAAAALETAILLVWLASAVALFQDRLAHAGYTAAPPLTWPESPAAEAIGYAAPTITPSP